MKELTSKMWFEWSDDFGAQEFTLKETHVQDCEDSFLENLHFAQHVKATLQKINMIRHTYKLYRSPLILNYCLFSLQNSDTNEANIF